MPSKIVFMGTSKFSIPALDILIKNHYNILSVYSQPPKRSKRGQKINVSPLHKFADKNNLPIRNISYLKANKFNIQNTKILVCNKHLEQFNIIKFK